MRICCIINFLMIFQPLNAIGTVIITSEIDDTACIYIFSLKNKIRFDTVSWNSPHAMQTTLTCLCMLHGAKYPNSSSYNFMEF